MEMKRGVEGVLSEGGLGRARRGSLYAMLHSPSMHLSWAQIAYLCLGAARGMAHLHAHRCLHRDLKSGAQKPVFLTSVSD